MDNPAPGIYTFDNFLTPDEVIKYADYVYNPPEGADCFTSNGSFKNRKFISQELADTFFTHLQAHLLYDRNRQFLRPNKYIMTGHYNPGDSFGLHTDTGLFYNASEGEASLWTLLIYLNDNFKGGATTFYTDEGEKSVSVQPQTGRAVLFDISLWHKGEPLESGEKLWIGCEIIGYLKDVHLNLAHSTD